MCQQNHHTTTIKKTSPSMDEWQESEALNELKREVHVPCPSSVIYPGVVSRVASYYIYLASIADNIEVPLGIETWKRETHGAMRQIFTYTRKTYTDLKDQATFFALHVANWLRTRGTSGIACPYNKASYNFITSLAKTKSCQCSCYSYYVLAAAEEFGYSSYISTCSLPEHLNVVLISPHETMDLTIADEDKGFLQDIIRDNDLKSTEAEALMTPRRDIYLGSRILATIEMSFKSSIPLQVFVSPESDVLNLEDEFDYVEVYDEIPQCRFPYVEKYTNFYKLMNDLLSRRIDFAEKYGNLKALYVLGCVFDLEALVDLIVKRALIHQRLEIARVNARDLVSDLKAREVNASVELVKYIALGTKYLESQKLVIALILDGSRNLFLLFPSMEQ